MGTERLLLVMAIGLLPCLAAADTMRCGSALISDGDTIDKVLDHCGEPQERTRTWIQRPPRFEFGGQEIPFEGTEDVPVDVWTYDFGSSRLIRRVRFVGDELVDIRTDGRGY